MICLTKKNITTPHANSTFEKLVGDGWIIDWYNFFSTSKPKSMTTSCECVCRRKSSSKMKKSSSLCYFPASTLSPCFLWMW